MDAVCLHLSKSTQRKSSVSSSQKGLQERKRRRTHSVNELVKAWMRNLNGRKSQLSSSRAIFLGMSVWCSCSPFESVMLTARRKPRTG